MGIGKDPPSDPSSSGPSSAAIGKDPSDPSSSGPSGENDVTVSSVKSSPHDISELEAILYYFGIRGPRQRGPKLIFRTSKDVFTVPLGQENNPRLMALQPVYEHHQLGKDDLWATVRSKVRRCLEAQKSVD